MKRATKATGTFLTIRPDLSVAVHGVDYRGATLHALTGTTVVIKTRGHSENPGSRHSGLKTYYSPTISVFKIVSRMDCPEMTLRVEPVVEFEAGRDEISDGWAHVNAMAGRFAVEYVED